MLTENLIRINRSIAPVLPWPKGRRQGHREFTHPELQLSGPEEIDLHKLEFHLYPYPERFLGNWIDPEYIYEYVMESSLINRCLNTRDAEEIKKAGSEIFSKYFGKHKIGIWKSVFEYDVQVLRGSTSGQPSLYYERIDLGLFHSSAPIVLYDTERPSE